MRKRLVQNVKKLNTYFQYAYKDSLIQGNHAEEAYIKLLKIQNILKDLALHRKSSQAEEMYILQKLSKEITHALHIIKSAEENQQYIDNIIEEYDKLLVINEKIIATIKNNEIDYARILVYQETSKQIERTLFKMELLVNERKK